MEGRRGGEGRDTYVDALPGLAELVDGHAPLRQDLHEAGFVQLCDAANTNTSNVGDPNDSATSERASE
jgi:hypothetical protein